MNSPHTYRGFTLVEMIVSLGLFTIIMFIATSAFLSIVNTDRKARSVRVAADNLNLALEDMSRRIKTGTGYGCGGASVPTDCPSGASSFSFTDQATTTRTTYTLSGGAILREGQRATSPEITITRLTFIVRGAPAGDNIQPSVLVLVDGALLPSPGIATTTFKIQTLITQRVYDN